MEAGRRRGGLHRLREPASRAHLDELADTRGTFGQQAGSPVQDRSRYGVRPEGPSPRSVRRSGVSGSRFVRPRFVVASSARLRDPVLPALPLGARAPTVAAFTRRGITSGRTVARGRGATLLLVHLSLPPYSIRCWQRSGTTHVRRTTPCNGAAHHMLHPARKFRTARTRALAGSVFPRECATFSSGPQPSRGSASWK